MENYLLEQIEKMEKVSRMYENKIDEKAWRNSLEQETKIEIIRGWAFANGQKQAFTKVLAEVKGYSIEDTRLFLKHKKEGLV